MSTTPTHVNSATLVMGPTGTGKSSLFATLAEYVWETYQLETWLASCDGGGFPAKVQALMRQGIMRVWRMRTRGEPFETCIRASAGWWPSAIDPRTGETAPNVRLVRPVTIRFEMYCPDGHLVKTVAVQAQLTPAPCPTCKKTVDKATMRVERKATVTQGFEKRGAMGVDGLTSALSWMMLHLGDERARGVLKGEEGALGGTITSGEMIFGSNNRSHYGQAQSRAEQMVLESMGVPNLVVPPMFTALLLETVDEGGLNIKGPKLAGKAKTDEAPQWFGNCLETMKVKNSDGAEVYRLYLQEYIDDANTRHLCKNRGIPGTLPPFLEDPPEPALAFTEFNLGKFFKLLDAGVQTAEAQAAEKYPDAPGVPEGMMTFGGTEAVPPSPPPPGAALIAAPRPVPPKPVPPATAPTPKPSPIAQTLAQVVQQGPPQPQPGPSAAPAGGGPPKPRAPARAPVAPPSGAAPELS